MKKRIGLAFIFTLGAITCLGRIVQIVDSSRLNPEDITWSNVDVAIWNMVEVHVGSVATNLPLMAPLFKRMGKRLKLSERLHLTWTKEGNDNQSASLYKAREPAGVEHGFKRMEELEFEDPTKQGIFTPIIGKGDAAFLDSMELVNLRAKGIMVKTDLEQTTA
ncbi:MAG: hypothetical protein Q9167_007778 [Letrouitia subvulpina]